MVLGSVKGSGINLPWAFLQLRWRRDARSQMPVCSRAASPKWGGSCGESGGALVGSRARMASVGNGDQERP